MEATPKVHRQRHHRSDSRHRRYERQAAQQQTTTSTVELVNEITAIAAAATSQSPSQSPVRELASVGQQNIAADDTCVITTIATTALHMTTQACEQQLQHRESLSDGVETLATTPSQTSQQTVLLVNGHVPPQEAQQELTAGSEAAAAAVPDKPDDGTVLSAPLLESPTQQQAAGSSRNSSGDALSLRETLQQLPTSITAHRHRRSAHSPQRNEADSSFHRGILGFMDRELKQSSPTPSALSAGGTLRKLQSLSDPQVSPAQRSVRSRSSLEKSPRRKRSKSESRRRRERKLIAAGEMEVRQANETLMRYLKQCTEMNDASLSGELEIDQNYDERRVHRKTKSQRDKRGHLISKLYTAGGLSSILKELSDDIVPAEGEEIYNPFTPVVSPTDDTPAHIDKMFLQTSSGYRPVEHCYYKYSFMGAHGAGGDTSAGGGRRTGSHTGAHAGCSAEGRICGRMGGGGGGGAAGVGRLRGSGSNVDTSCLLETAGYGTHSINTNIQLACVIQRIWLLISNICHGLLAGLALAHLLFVLSSHPMDWYTAVNDMDLAEQAAKKVVGNVAVPTMNLTLDAVQRTLDPTLTGVQNPPVVGDYATFADIYLNTFYCLAIVCLVSVFDRMDICNWQLSSPAEIISFRWLIIAMIYIATIILTICSNSIDEKLYYYNNTNITLTQDEMLSRSVASMWSSLSVTRSIGAICGWFMISLAPHEDLLYEHLVDMTSH